MNGVSQKREVTTTISYVGAVPVFKKMKNMLLEKKFFSNVQITLNM